MRISLILAAAFLLTGCASQSKGVASCPALTPLQIVEAIVLATNQTFGQRREGYHTYIEPPPLKDAQGNLVMTLERIGPSFEPMPEPGQGWRMTMVVQPCTGKLLSAKRI